MKRLALFGYGLALSAATGCTVDQNNALYVLQNQTIEAGMACSVSGSATAAGRLTGLLDVSQAADGWAYLNPGYIYTPLVVNGGTASATNPSLHIITLQGADITLTPSTTTASQQLITSLAAQQLDKRTQRFFATVKPGGSAGIAYAAIDLEQTAALASLVPQGTIVQVIAHMTIFGQSDGGDVVSTPIDYPINLCHGCLWTNLGACPVPSSTDVHKGGACNLIQDDLVDCCGSLTCPATKS